MKVRRDEKDLRRVASLKMRRKDLWEDLGEASKLAIGDKMLVLNPL